MINATITMLYMIAVLCHRLIVIVVYVTVMYYNSYLFLKTLN